MNVREILTVKGRDVVTIEPHATLASAINVLTERRIGAVVVTGPDDRIVGILSERDIVTVIAKRGHDAFETKVSEVMTRKVTTCNPADTISSIMERMTAGKFRHVPVVEQNRLTGIVSIGDVVKHRLMEMEHEHAALCDYIQTA